MLDQGCPRKWQTRITCSSMGTDPAPERDEEPGLALAKPRRGLHGGHSAQAKLLHP